MSIEYYVLYLWFHKESSCKWSTIVFVKKRKQKTFKQRKVVPSINDDKNLETSSNEFLTVMLNT